MGLISFVQRISRVQDVVSVPGVPVEALDSRSQFGTANHSSGFLTREMTPLLLPFSPNEHDDCRPVDMAIEVCAGLSILYCQGHCAKRLMLYAARIQR